MDYRYDSIVTVKCNHGVPLVTWPVMHADSGYTAICS